MQPLSHPSRRTFLGAGGGMLAASSLLGAGAAAAATPEATATAIDNPPKAINSSTCALTLMPKACPASSTRFDSSTSNAPIS